MTCDLQVTTGPSPKRQGPFHVSPLVEEFGWSLRLRSASHGKARSAVEQGEHLEVVASNHPRRFGP